MIRNYLKTAWRNLLGNKTTSFISMAGLAVGISCFLLLATYLVNELRYDTFHKNAGNIVRVAYKYQSPDDKEPRELAVTPTATVHVYKQQFSEIEDGVRIFNYSGNGQVTVSYGDKLFAEKQMLTADGSFFKIFSFNFLEGNAQNALSDPSSIVISSSAAKKYFGNEDPMGKVLKLNSDKNLTVTGVIEDVPSYSQIKFDMIANSAIDPGTKDLRWSSASNYSYLLLKPGTNRQALAKKMDAFIANIMKGEGRKGTTQYLLESLTKVHLYSKALYSLDTPGNLNNIYTLGVVAVILLLLACVNFLNLVTARSAERGKEIGVRKVMGAVRGQLFVQFIIEAAIITLVSLLIGVFILYLALPGFSTFTGQELSLHTWNASWLIGALIGLFVLVSFLAGTYPSLYLSAFKPIATLKGTSTTQPGGNLLRKSLVVFQFVVSVFFIISTLIAGNQLKFMQTVDTGINRDQVIVMDIGGLPYNKIEAFKNDLKQQSGIVASTASYDSPVNVRGGYSINAVDGKPTDYSLSVTAIPIEKDFVKTLGIKLLSGGDFNLSDEKAVQDTAYGKRKYSFILNETAVKAMGWKPEEAVGKRIGLNGRVGFIKAVAKDFNFASLHEEITPIVMFAEYDWFGKLLIKASAKNMQQTVTALQSKWKAFYPNKPFEYHFLDEEYEELYKADLRTGGILKAFTAVTIFISCLGLFGLAVFSTRLRTKEIGIRKVLGAGVTNIAALVSFDFIKLVIIAVIIASPLAYYVMHKWLQDFAFKVEIQWWIFALSAAFAVFIALATVSYQSVKAALTNPIKTLRSE
ncbi:MULTISPECIES: ABC transporter permease [unclassified Mucilaginibacter]|uniref:ABC transporter permease n=1 Tax=unclassified Mucilaginibacter TaxID=2617802 RepID=UPI000959826A|nr:MULTISPECIES: ABC transporter permease [unclassified Mucilaginibacter]OJW18222.1 MAG: hypothetical protein BGO48_16820 [Mucilaginibacter sp. 44-25]PLW89829.1 MAG: ABC transporter permease [Mucilaginibacter sp.]HEK19967.1 ABC transporter permease [Bacteroidota bacterium]